MCILYKIHQLYSDYIHGCLFFNHKTTTTATTANDNDDDQEENLNVRRKVLGYRKYTQHGTHLYISLYIIGIVYYKKKNIYTICHFNIVAYA